MKPSAYIGRIRAMNAYDRYAQAMAQEKASYYLAQETGWKGQHERVYKLANKAKKECLKEFPEKALTHTITGETEEQYGNTDFDELVEKEFAGEAVAADSESGFLCIYCHGSLTKKVMAFLKKHGKFESLGARKGSDPSVAGLGNWDDAIRHCEANGISVVLELSEADKKSLKSWMEERKREITEKAQKEADEIDVLLAQYI